MTTQLDQAWELAKQRYAAVGIDVEEALRQLDRLPVSMHCWQGDDVAGFENPEGNLTGGIQATGNYPGKARNATELRLRTEVQTSLEQWQTANGEVKAFNQTILPAAQSAVESATRGFEMGKFGFLDVLDAQRTLIAARSQYIQAVSEATDARVRIERIFGDLSVRP